MLAEYLENAGTDTKILWHSVMNGVRVCSFEINKESGDLPFYLSSEINPKHFEILFCFRGTLIISRDHGIAVTASQNEIVLVSDSVNYTSAQIVNSLKGILISVDENTAREDYAKLCGIIHEINNYARQTKELADKQHGCVLIHSTPWTRMLFSATDSLPFNEKGRYCVLKAVELMYLLCMHSELTDNVTGTDFSDSYVIRTVTQMRKYIEKHIDEKITIEKICREYNISSTAFKKYFKYMYGLPVHKWVSEKRMLLAADYLHSTPMSIIQIAQMVGYDGVSQFNVVFKRKYGITPGQYRKISNTVDFKPIP